MSWDSAAQDAMKGRPPSAEVALQMLGLPDEATLGLIDAAWRVRRRFFGRKVRGHVLVSANRGGCAEDCAYCAQSLAPRARASPSQLVSASEIVKRASAAKAAGADRLCIVTSGRSPRLAEMATVTEATRRVKLEVGLEVCASLGIIGEETARALKQAGLDAYNHNLNTSARRYRKICTTHRYEERLATIAAAAAQGLSVCSGVIVGMGESDRELVEMALILRRLAVSSIPVNFLLPVVGTPLGDGQTAQALTPWRCLRILSMFRFVNPSADLRVSAGREQHLRSLQPLSLLVATSLFLGDYLTQPGRSADADCAMVVDLGLAAVREGAAGLRLGTSSAVGR